MRRQNKPCKSLMQVLFILTAITFVACKKDDKDNKATGYELKIVSGNHRTDSSNKQTTEPLVIAIYKDGKQLGRNDFYPYTITLNNFVCGSEELSDYDVSYQPDGTVWLNWFTGEVAGTQRVLVSLKDDARSSLAQAEASVDVTLNSNGWHAACQKPQGLLVAAADRFFMFSENEGGMSSEDGITWTASVGLPLADLFGSRDYRPNVIGHNDIIYAMFPNVWEQERTILYVSTNRGKSWKVSDGFPKNCRLLAVINDETLVLSSPQGLSATAYKDGTVVNGELLIPAGSFVDFALNTAHAFALDQFGGLYRAAGYNGKYTLVNEALKLQKILVKGNTLYGFSGNKAYRSDDNGGSFTLLANIPGSVDARVEDAMVTGDHFYIVRSNSFSTHIVTSTSDWHTFTDPLTATKYIANSRSNFCIKENGTVLFQKPNGSLLYKKP